MTTIETLTDRQIRGLRREAATAGDRAMVAICDVALQLAEIADIDHEVRADLERLGILPAHVDADGRARAEIARVIADAEAHA